MCEADSRQWTVDYGQRRIVWRDYTRTNAWQLAGEEYRELFVARDCVKTNDVIPRSARDDVRRWFSHSLAFEETGVARIDQLSREV